MDKRTFTLEAMQEFRFEVDSKAFYHLKLIKGKAELFGTELAVDVEYQFTSRKLAVFTFHGCELEVRGKSTSEYVGEETPMASILNIHFALQKLRQDAYQQDKGGPRVMIVGPSDAGKSSLAKILTSYAARSASYPIFCDIDPASVCAYLN